jgi:hypothetical protein
MPTRRIFSDELRAAIESSEMTRYAMAKLTGIPQSQLSRFVHRQSGLAIENIDKLCDLLDLRLVGPAKRKVKPKRNEG